jgi:TetR/AcrR family transcriptional regulator
MMRAMMDLARISRKTAARRQPGRPGRNEPDGALLLLQSAQSVFANLGYRAATLRKIASTVGVDPALVIHRFGSKGALWRAVIERQALYLSSFIADLQNLQAETKIPIQTRIETTFRLLVTMTFGEPECGMLIARISSEHGEELDMLVEKLLRPTYYAVYPLLVEAAEAHVIKAQRLETLYFMILNALTISVSYRHVMGYFNDSFQDVDQLKEDMTQFLIVNFLQNPPS